jgi:hypothetical protein
VIGKGPIENSNLATPPLLLTMVENCRPAYHDSFSYETRTQEKKSSIMENCQPAYRDSFSYETRTQAKKSSITLEPTLDGYAVDEQSVPTPPVDAVTQEFIMHQQKAWWNNERPRP